ncbi:dihydrodipicolinate synthase family protein [candidate division KSB1 bacterium]|nr:dihydrodipicolinate synthase family protein [candidate division KSB1 bacterium]
MTIEKSFNLIPAVFTPMSPNGDINLSVIKSYAQHLYKNGMSTIFVNGTTGESLFLTVEERRLIMEEWSRVSPPEMQFITHVGHNCIKSAKELAKHAQQLNVHAISAMTPIFLKPATDDDLIDFLLEIAMEAPDTPFYFYYIPSMSHYYLNMLEFLEKAIKRIPTLVGVKYTSEDLMEYRKCVVKFGDKLNILFGRDELLLHGLMLGAKGAVGTNYNFIGPLFLKIVAAYQAGQIEKARLIADKTTAFANIFVSSGFLSIGKPYMNEFGVDCGTVRLPLKTISDERYNKFLQDIAALELDKI